MPLFNVGETVQVKNGAGPLSRKYPRQIKGVITYPETGNTYYEFHIGKGKRAYVRHIQERFLLEDNPERIPLLPERVSP